VQGNKKAERKAEGLVTNQCWEVPHCRIRTAQASSHPSMNGWVVSVDFVGAISMCEAFIFLQLYRSTCPSAKMCVGCLGSFLNKPNVFRRNSLPRAARARRLCADYSPALHEQPRSASRGRSRQGQINHRYNPRKIKNHKQVINHYICHYNHIPLIYTENTFPALWLPGFSETGCIESKRKL